MRPEYQGGVIHLFHWFWDDVIKPDIAVQLVISEISLKIQRVQR